MDKLSSALRLRRNRPDTRTVVVLYYH